MPLVAAVSRPTRPPNADATFDAEVSSHWPLERAAAPPLPLTVEREGPEGRAAECGLGFVVRGGFEPLDIVGADEDAIDAFPWVADVPVALWWVELHPANVAPHIANTSAGTARRHHTAMSSTPPVATPMAPASTKTVTCQWPRRRRSGITFTIRTCPILFGS